MQLLKRKSLVYILKTKLQTSSRLIQCKYKRLSYWALPVGHDTNISVYNSATKKKVPLILKSPSYASWYMCGPTVYDSAHIGHACTYVKFDIIRRIMIEHFNVNVVMVMGITDIDDKIILRAKQQKQDLKSLTSHYEAEFVEEMRLLNVLAPTFTTRVTDFIPHIIQFVQQIVDKGQGYVTEDGSVYFDTPKCASYGKLAPVPEEGDDTKSATLGKRSTLDFALWKAAKSEEPWWKSPWGNRRGRPGWHIECSAMASALLGPSLDLHSGGIDLLFPHHENEEAQSCVAHGVAQWVNYWLHTGHLHLKGDLKMSKSLKNTVSIKELLKTYSANEFRLFCLLSRYRNVVEFSDVSMNNATAICKRIESFLSDAENYIRGQGSWGRIDEPKLMEMLISTQTRLHSYLSDDFDTGKVITSLLELISATNKMLSDRDGSDNVSHPACMAAVSFFVRRTLDTFGMNFSTLQHSSSSSLQLQTVLDCAIEFRDQVRSTAIQQKEHSLLRSCDQLRDKLGALGVVIKDHGKSSSWSFTGDK